MFDFVVGGIALAPLILGIVEAAKQFGVNGRGSQVLSFALGIFFVGLAQAMSQGLIPELYIPYVVWAVTALAGGLAAMGLYDFGKKFRQ